MPTLSDNHGRRIAGTFAHLDRLLCDIERAADPRPSPFADELPDLTEAERTLVRSLVVAARGRMLAALDRLGLPRPHARTSARWSIEVALQYADIALTELAPERLTGYGALDPDAATELGGVVAALRETISAGRSLLRPAEWNGLRERLRGLGGPAGAVLRKMEEVATDRGLVTVLPLIAIAADRVEAADIEVGIFGRVSAGKSSLINAIIGEAVLPVGAVPVTAVPLRIVHGPAACRVTYHDNREESIALSQLTTFATETGNPANVRAVRAIRIQSPALAPGLALLDTPGVGSLNTSGPAQAFAWLPRCDLGLVLVAAGTPMGGDELALVRGLVQAGIVVSVFLSKADLIAPRERESAVAYVQRELAAAAGGEVIDVRPVSVIGEDAALLEQWRDEVLMPLVANRHAMAKKAVARRIRALFGAMCAAARDQAGFEPGSIELHQVRLAAQRDVDAAARALAGAVATALERGAYAASAAWRSGSDAAAAVRAALVAEPARVVEVVQAGVRRVAEVGASGQVSAADEPGASAIGHRIPPLFDPVFLDKLPIMAKPSIGARLAPRRAAAHALKGVETALRDAYTKYAERVRAWGYQCIDEAYEQAAASRGHMSDVVPPGLESLAAAVDASFPPPT